jgi:hypothetical protein
VGGASAWGVGQTRAHAHGTSHTHTHTRAGPRHTCELWLTPVSVRRVTRPSPQSPRRTDGHGQRATPRHTPRRTRAHEDRTLRRAPPQHAHITHTPHTRRRRQHTPTLDTRHHRAHSSSLTDTPCNTQDRLSPSQSSSVYSAVRHAIKCQSRSHACSPPPTPSVWSARCAPDAAR